MRLTGIFLISAFLTFSASAGSAAAQTPLDLSGTWTLDSIADGQNGLTPTRLLITHRDGVLVVERTGGGVVRGRDTRTYRLDGTETAGKRADGVAYMSKAIAFGPTIVITTIEGPCHTVEVFSRSRTDTLAITAVVESKYLNIAFPRVQTFSREK